LLDETTAVHSVRAGLLLPLLRLLRQALTGLEVQIGLHVFLSTVEATPSAGILALAVHKDRVEHELALVVVRPALVEVAAGEAEAATAVRTLAAQATCCFSLFFTDSRTVGLPL
jgi:hypothetical protein